MQATTWTAPGTPTALSAAAGDTRLDVSWTAPTSTGGTGANITGYLIRWRTAAVGATAAGNWNDNDGVATDSTTGHAITSLSNNTAYDVEVRALNGINPGSSWATATGTPTATPTPQVSLSLSPARVAEGSPVTVTTTLSDTLATEVIIPLTLTPGPNTEPDDYGTLASITIPANTRSATGTITTTEDADTEEDSFTVTLGTLPTGVRLGSPSSATVTITEGDAATPATPTDTNATNQAVLPELAQVLTDVSVSAVTRRIGQVTQRGAGGNAGSSADGDTSAGESTDTGGHTLASLARHHAHTLEQGQSLTSLLNGSEFNVPLNHLFEYREGWASTLTLWGSGSYRDLNSDRGWDGDITSAQLGLDAWVSENWLLGVAGAWSEGDIDYRAATGSDTQQRNYTLTLYTIHPYIAWTPSDRVQLWASGGYGQGEIDIETEDRRVQSDVDQWLVAGGGSLRLVQRNTDSLHLKVEAQQAWTESDRSADLTALSVKGHTLRATLEANRRMVLATGNLTPSLELGVRHDGGDGDTGTGAIVGATLRWQGTQGLQLDVGGEALLGRDDYEEWSVWGLVGWQREHRRGWSFTLQPRYGREGGASDINRLWRHEAPGLSGSTSPAHSALADTQTSLDLRLAHALGCWGGLLTPYSELRLGEQQRLRLGLQWRLGERWDLDLRAERNGRSGNTTTGKFTTDHSILLEGRIRH